MAMTSANSSLDDRLSLLESKLGIGVGIESGDDVTDTDTTFGADAVDISSRVTWLLDSASSRLRQQKQEGGGMPMSVEGALLECEALAASLEASGLLFHTASTSSGDNPSPSLNASTSTPVIYRKQEVLARSEELQRAMSQLAKIRDLLSISNQKLIQALQQKNDSNIIIYNGNGSISEHVANAPILVGPSFHFASDDVNKQKLVDLNSRIIHVSEETNRLTAKCDHLINVYYKLIHAANQKFILHQEGKEKETQYR